MSKSEVSVKVTRRYEVEGSSACCSHVIILEFCGTQEMKRRHPGKLSENYMQALHQPLGPFRSTSSKLNMITMLKQSNSFKNVFFWDIMSYGSCKNRRFRGTIASIIRETRNGELRTTLSVTRNRSMLLVLLRSVFRLLVTANVVPS
jgi:hypothetical protein